MFPKPAYFRHSFQVPKANFELKAPVRLKDFVVNGRLELSLKDYLELVMANNTDIAIQRLSLEAPRYGVLRAFGVFDPSFVGSFNATRAKSAPTSVLQNAGGGSMLNQLTQNADFSYLQTLVTGTQVNVGFTGSKNSSNDVYTTWNPALNSVMRVNFTQPLLRNRGAYITRLPVTIAKSTQRKSEYEFRNQMLQLLTVAENTYWDLVSRRETLKVQEEALKLSDALLKRSQKELELGAIPELDLYRPQQTFAQAEFGVSRARYELTTAEDALRKQIGADLDPDVRTLPITLTETVLPTVDPNTIEKEQTVQKAVSLRPDLMSARQSLDIDDLNIKGAANNLRPDLALTAGYQASGRGGTGYIRENVFGGGSQIVGTVPGGFGDALSQMFGLDVPRYSFGLTLRFPIRDRARTAELATYMVAKRSDVLRVRSLEQQIRLDVLNAITQVESSKASIKLATTVRDFALKQLEAEQKKYDLGTSVIYFVQQAQQDLTAAESQLVNTTITYRRNLLNLMRMTGDLLEVRGVKLQ